jgi:hypothetical protein
MRRYLLATTALAVAAPVHAQTLIETRRTDPVRTSTIRNGAPDAIRITIAGSIVPTGGTAVTVDSTHAVTNQGTVQISNANNAIGIDADAGTGGGITNSGTITVDETYTATDADNDGDLDGPLATGSARAGIRTRGAYTGAISHSGRIVVEGNDSAGIRLGGPLTGAFTHEGETNVVGDRSVGVRTQAVNGNVRLAGRIGAQGAGAVGAQVAGDVTGALVVQGSIGASGYRYPTAPTDPSRLDGDDLLQGGPGLLVEGSVTGGIILAVPPRDLVPTDPDEDKDGIEDAREGSAAVSSFGAAPAVQIGATDRAIAIGPVAGNGAGFGLVIDGIVSGSGVYAGVEGSGLAIGGRGGAVTIAGGIGIAGTVQAAANGASATAVRLGAGASTPEMRVSGTVSAAGGGTAASRSTAILVDTGASLGTIRNSGTIRATAQAADGSATAILDRSGTVRLIENSGAIGATGAAATSDRNVAIDLSAATAGVTVRQTAVAAGITAPVIVGDIRLGGFDDVLEIADGGVTGTARLGQGSNRLALSGDAVFTGSAVFGAGADTLSLAGTSLFSGTADLGGGADTLTLTGTARFAGRLVNAGAVAVSVGGGVLDLQGANAIGSLSVASGGTLVATLDRAGATGTAIDVAGTASFAQGSKLALRVASLTGAEGRYVVLRAGTLTGAAGLAVDGTVLPFLYKGTLATGAANELTIDLSRKTAGELGLNRAQSALYEPALTALATDAKLGATFLGITDGAAFRQSLSQLLPDHADGTFEMVSQGSRAIARFVADPHGMYKDEGKWGWWLTQVGFGGSRDTAESAYDLWGWGTAAGAEVKTGIGNVGASVAFLYGRNTQDLTDNEVTSNQYEVAGYWRGRWAGLQANLRGSVAKLDLSGSRRFAGVNGTEIVERATESDRGATLGTFTGTVSYEMGGATAFFRPVVSIDYHRLNEEGYAESGGGTGFDLTVDRRISDELALTGSVAGGFDFFGGYQGEGWFRLEAEGGRRELVGGAMGATVARFGSGQRFTIVPEERESGWVGKLRTIGGTRYFRLGAELNAEERANDWAFSLRASLQVGL